MHIVLLKCPHVQIAFLKFTSCDNQALATNAWLSQRVNLVYSNCCCSCSFEPEIIKIGQSSLKMYSNNILNFQESTTILYACTKKSQETYWMHDVYIYIYIYKKYIQLRIYIYVCSYVYMYICMYIYMSVCMYVYMWVWVSVCVWTLASFVCDMNWWLSCRVLAMQSVVAGSISSGGDYGIHCWWDLIRSKQLSSVPVCRV